MKIINIIKAILLLSVVITLPSCLDLDPKAQLADANLWQTPNDYKLYTNQFYEWPRDFAAALFDGPHSDTRSDLITSSDYNEYSKGVNTIPVSDGNGLVEAAQFMGIEINDNPKYEAFVQEILGMIERYNRKYRTKDVLFNCEMIPAENVGVKHAKWDKEAGFQTFRECYNSYFYIVEDKSLNVVDKFRLHGRRYIKHLTGGSALHMNLEEHLSKEQYRQLLRVAAIEGCNYFTFNIPNTICNECKHIDKRYLHECPECHSRNVDYLTRVIGYMKRISNFSQARQKEAAQRYYAPLR